MIFNKEKFRELRSKCGLSLEEIAAAFEVTPARVSRWGMNGKSQPRPNKIPQLALLLQCRESDLATFGPNDAPSLPIVTSFLRIYRERAKLSREDLAQKLGVDEARLNKWETFTEPHDRQLNSQLQEILHLTPHEIDLINDDYSRYMHWQDMNNTKQNGGLHNVYNYDHVGIENFRSAAIQEIIRLDAIPLEIKDRILKLLVELTVTPGTKSIDR